jgi:hypothetical protein
VVAQAAQKAGIAFAAYDAPAGRSESRRGDTITALVDLTEGTTVRQWVVVLAADDLTAEEKRLPVAKGVRLFTTTGNEYEFASAWSAVSIQTLGPYLPRAKDERSAIRQAKNTRSRAFANAAFLGIGFKRACRLSVRVNEVGSRLAERTGKPVTFEFASGTAPYTAERVAESRASLRDFALTADEERAMVGSAPALLAFYEVVQRTPGLRDVLSCVVDVPWFSILAHGGKAPAANIRSLSSQRLDPAPWGLSADHEIYSYPFILELNGKAALICQMAVVEARPPLLTSAGIVGLAARRPDGQGPQLMIRVVSARCAQGPAAGP